MKNLNVFMLGAAMLIAVSCSETKSKTPDNLKKALTERFPGVTDAKWEKENDTEWEAEFNLDGVEYSVSFKPDGNLL
jgi:hypothetical protein